MGTIFIFLLGVATGGFTSTQLRYQLNKRNQKSAERERQHDELKQIKGIGSVYAERLHAAGIRSLSDLVNTSPSKLFAIASDGRLNARIDAEHWIAQAHTILAV